MSRIYGSDRTRGQIAELAGDLAAFGGVRLVTLGDGVERGQRMLDFRTGSGLRFTVLVDRAMDIAEVEHKGRSIGWHAPTGFRAPALHELEGEDGLGLLRGFSGFLVTCGLDHILGDEVVSAETYDYPRRSRVTQPLHGRIAMEPARLVGYGERWEGDRCILWAEGEIRQAANFAENLRLVRRIEADLGSDEIRLIDRVVNVGFSDTPHMLLYHVNIGHPVLDAGSRYLAPVRDVLWASHADAYEAQGVGYARACAPRVPFTEQVWEHEMAADADGRVPVALVNDGLGLGIEVETLQAQLPCNYAWQNFRSGAYAFGLEPATHHIPGDGFARERGEMIWLGPQETRDYEASFRVLDGAEAIAASETRIRAIAEQPDEDFPPPSGNFRRLWGAGEG
ncbi:hypothetical protein OG2516_12699 [Oceanicola granulosus HTCC2516]|uniref:DUF4432 domain-containing protein n=1 Tax=Oceanicola granulosus (strain ATCC BAA-861 / DSM 15982 / KCTC 12143 / HTCC2516) TaxID=314256 RepID=Q2CC41_OCEGH|nr:aldose 1-epimerase family protein [Oceanicola granulosus]EAR50240.1 hypothetical protein OG2516_12699 [Oceanicola granulosus HTCC2516]